MHRPMVAVAREHKTSKVYHDCREAFLNSQLAASWRAGEAWAAQDYYGLELGKTAAARHQAKCRQVDHCSLCCPDPNAGVEWWDHYPADTCTLELGANMCSWRSG